MAVLTISNLLKMSIFLFLLAASLSLILHKNHKLSNIASNIICIIASIFSGASSILHIFSDNESLIVLNIPSAVPFINLNITLDKLSAFFILILSVLVLSVSIYSIGYISHYYNKRNVGLLNFLYSTFIVSMILVLTSQNMVFFFIAWEIMAAISYFLVIFESENKENRSAGILYIIMSHVGTAFLLIAFMIIFSYTKSFDIFTSSSSMPLFAKNIVFILFIVGFGTKAGVVPIHIWLPYAHPSAPSNISALMSGIMIKTAIYGILRFVLLYLGVENTWWGILILIIGVMSTVLGAAYAFVEENIKKMLAFSSIENIGIIFIGLGIGFIGFANNNPTVGALALTASLFHTFNHAFFKGSLFLSAGSIHYSTHTKNMEQLGGLIKKMPITALFVLGGSLSIAALVPFNGFVSEWLTYQSIFANITPGYPAINTVSILTVAALALSGALVAGFFIKLFGISFLGLPRSEHSLHAKEVPTIMNIGIGILVSICLIVGLFPMLFLKIIDKITLALTEQSIIGQLNGGFLIAYSSINISGNVISPLEVLFAIILLIAAALILIKIIGGKYIERKYGTWDCGFEALSSRMQYSSVGFSKPIKIVFRILFRPSRQLKVEASHKYHPHKMEYTVTAESIFEKYVYNPALLFVKNLSRKIKFSIQTGSVHVYLLYIFIAVLVLMLYNRLM